MNNNIKKSVEYLISLGLTPDEYRKEYDKYFSLVQKEVLSSPCGNCDHEKIDCYNCDGTGVVDDGRCPNCIMGKICCPICDG